MGSLDVGLLFTNIFVGEAFPCFFFKENGLKNALLNFKWFYLYVDDIFALFKSTNPLKKL